MMDAEKPLDVAVTVAAAAPLLLLTLSVATHPPPPATEAERTESELVTQPPAGRTAIASAGAARGVPYTAKTVIGTEMAVPVIGAELSHSLVSEVGKP